MNKKEFEFKDRLIKGISKDGHFKISVVKTTELVKEARERHALSLLNTVILGRALTATMLMASELKGEERIRLRMEGNGPIGSLVAEANSLGEVRGYVANPSAESIILIHPQHSGRDLDSVYLHFPKHYTMKRSQERAPFN